ncbi:unnamed protein product [Durusdinium trenchii]|uniref:Class I SAM-dependent methyltransferase n=1 Tax=Durusdinium trenchii TaxID=1381693 RepID=A0ABP0LRI4_9DINO
MRTSHVFGSCSTGSALWVRPNRRPNSGIGPWPSPTLCVPSRRLRPPQGLPGYGQPGSRARVYYELACQSAHLLAHNVLSLCHKLSGSLLDEQQMQRKVKMLHIARHLSSDMHRQAGYFFRIAIELLGHWQLTGSCSQREDVAQVLANSLQSHWKNMAKALEELGWQHQSYAPGMGSTSNVLVERMTSPALVDFWMKLVEGVMSTTCLDLVLNLVILVSYLAEDAVRLKTHLFAQLYLTELRLSPPGTAAEGVAVALPVDRAAPASRGHVPFVFRRWRCCLRYHVLLQLLEEIAQQRAQETKTPVSVSMIEIGVHTASTARFLLDRAPFLHWTGIDPYEDHSGDALFHEASRHLARFGHRARLLRRRSEEAWETSGALHGVELHSVDLLFVDGDHDYNATFQDLVAWARFVRPGGIVAGHDIFNPVNDGVTEAVEDLLRGKNVVVNFATDHVFWWHT